MRVYLLLVGLVVGVVSCASAPSAVKAPPNSPATASASVQPAPAKGRPAPSATELGPRDPTAPAMVSAHGLEGLTEVFVDPQYVGTAEWKQAVGLDGEQFKTEVEARVRRIPGLKVTSERSQATPRLLVHVQGHTIPGFPGEDPPAAAHMTVVLLQPVFLTRRGPWGQTMITTAGCDEATVFSTGKASTMKERVQAKIAHLLDGFAKDYAQANPKAR